MIIGHGDQEVSEGRPQVSRTLISVTDAAALLGVSKSSVYMLFTRGRLTRYGTRGRRMADLGEVQRIYREWNPPDHP